MGAQQSVPAIIPNICTMEEIKIDVPMMPTELVSIIAEYSIISYVRIFDFGKVSKGNSAYYFNNALFAYVNGGFYTVRRNLTGYLICSIYDFPIKIRSVLGIVNFKLHRKLLFVHVIAENSKQMIFTINIGTKEIRYTSEEKVILCSGIDDEGKLYFNNLTLAFDEEKHEIVKTGYKLARDNSIIIDELIVDSVCLKSIATENYKGTRIYDLYDYKNPNKTNVISDYEYVVFICRKNVFYIYDKQEKKFIFRKEFKIPYAYTQLSMELYSNCFTFGDVIVWTD